MAKREFILDGDLHNGKGRVFEIDSRGMPVCSSNGTGMSLSWLYQMVYHAPSH